MNHEFLRMQKLSGVITEGEYNQKIEELNSTESSTETLNENVVGVGGTMNPYPTKKKEVYESAFSKFLGEEKDEMEEGKEEVEEYGGMKYEEPVDEAKEDLEEDERTDTEEEGYKDGFKDALKDAKDAIAKLRKELKEEDEIEEGLNEDARTDAEEEGYKDGFKDAIKDALDALKGIKGELKEEDLSEESKKEKEEGDMRDDGGESFETKRTEKMRDDM